MKQHTMVAMMATNRRMEEAMPAMVVGLRGREKMRLSLPPTSFRQAYYVYQMILRDTQPRPGNSRKEL